MNAITMHETAELAIVPQGPLGTAIQALQAGMSIEQMQGLMGLQKDWEANEARKAYVADMAVFKLNPPVILKDKGVGYANKDGSFTGYMHATLGGVTEKVVAALAQHGFSHSWDTTQKDGGQIFVTCKLTHRLGHSESTALNSSADISGKKNNIQAMASTVTYLQRYTLLAACGLATMDMGLDDGRESEGEQYDAEIAIEVRKIRISRATNNDELRALHDEAGAFFEKDVKSWNAIRLVIAKKKVELNKGEPA
jgi:hypothetical protein